MTSQTTDVSILNTEAEAAAARLCRRLRLPPCEQNDLRQELLLDLIRRLPKYDASRGSLAAFANVVLRNQAIRITGRVMRERRAQGGQLLSLDAAMAGGTTLADTLSDEHGLAAWLGRSTAMEEAERRVDVARALRELDTSDRALCAAVAYGSIDQLVARGVGPRAGLYRRLRTLGPVLAAYGLQAA